MTDDLNEKLDYVRDRVVADAKAKPTPEEIIAEACGLIPPFDFPVEQIMEAFARHGKVIVDREPTEEMLIAARDWSYEKYGKPIGNDAAIGVWRAMTTDTGS